MKTRCASNYRGERCSFARFGAVITTCIKNTVAWECDEFERLIWVLDTGVMKGKAITTLKSAALQPPDEGGVPLDPHGITIED